MWFPAAREEPKRKAEQQHQQVISNNQDNCGAQGKHKELSPWLVAECFEVLGSDLVQGRVCILQFDTVLAVEHLTAGGFCDVVEGLVVDLVFARSSRIAKPNDVDGDVILA